MRTTAGWIAALVLGGAGVFWWQRSQIASLRQQVARQGAALEDSRERVDELSRLVTGPTAYRPLPARVSPRAERDYDGAAVRAEERRVILGQYRDVLARMDLPPATASGLEDLLTDRVEAFLDAQDAAKRQGFAEGSAETEGAVAAAIAANDREIADFLGPDADRRLNRILVPAAAQPAVMPEAAAPPVVVTVVVQAPQAPDYGNAAAQPAVSYADNPYSPYYFYPYPGFFVVGTPAHGFAAARSGPARQHRGILGPRPRYSQPR
ncbi:MAG TPA: hypothetical protein VN775_00665 [Opitutaceae bacterium]|nr:hypothetical protein [Opitutaceae bacterium]